MQKKLVILGAGESGLGAALLGRQKGWEIFVSDNRIIKNPYKTELQKHKIIYEEKKHTTDIILQADCIVKSPGVPNDIPIVKKIYKQNILILSEIEFAVRYTHAKIIAITGSNGKTTTTFLICELLKKAGFNVCIAGNMNESFARKVASENPDYFVLEVSSFQLDNIYEFKPHIAVLLNITPDHLDRYNHNFLRYVMSKFNITRNQLKNDFFIYNKDDIEIYKYLKKRKIKANMLSFSQHKALREGAFVNGSQIKFVFKKRTFEIPLKKISLSGKHNIYNAMAAGTVGCILNIDNQSIYKCLSSFKGVEHRLEKVLTISDVIFINDSKATNVNATWYALESVKNSIIWIAGGTDKGNDYTVLQNLVKEKVKAIICLTKNAIPLYDAFQELTKKMINVDSMENAVKTAYNMAVKGDTVLLSPACASFDLFENYEDRGKQFKKAVRNL